MLPDGVQMLGLSTTVMPSEPLVTLFQFRVISRSISENAMVTTAK